MYVSNTSEKDCTLSMAKGLKGRRHIVTLICLPSTTYKFEIRKYKCLYTPSYTNVFIIQYS